jgi:hypothetical protein
MRASVIGLSRQSAALDAQERVLSRIVRRDPLDEQRRPAQTSSSK